MTDVKQQKKLKKVGKHGVIHIGRQIAIGVLCGKFDRRDVIVKRVDIFKNCDMKELDYLRSFHHENVVQYLYHDVDEQFLYIVLEKCDCTLAEFMTDKKHESNLCHIDVLRQIIKGMVYLHEDKDIVHRDLKPHNILMIYRDRRWVAKITDFDISKQLPRDRTRVTQSVVRGTGSYMAPEQIMGHKVGKSIDIFSCGLVFHYVLSDGAHPFGSNDAEAEQKMLAGNATPDLNNLKDEYKHYAESLILAMISHKQEDRLCIREVQAHHLFWTSKRKLHFYQDVSDYIITPPERFQKMKLVLNVKEIADDWRQTTRNASRIVGAVLDKMKNRRQGDEVCDLLRNIRNLAHHYDEKEDEFHEAIGNKTDGLCQFFQANFPKLLNHVYESMKLYKAEEIFRDYYTYREGEHSSQKTLSNDATQSETRRTNSSDYADQGDDLSEREFEHAVRHMIQRLSHRQLEGFSIHFLQLDSPDVIMALGRGFGDFHHGAMMLVRWWRQKQPGATPEMLHLLCNQFQWQSEGGFPDQGDDLSEGKFEHAVSLVIRRLSHRQLEDFAIHFLQLDSHDVIMALYGGFGDCHHGTMMLVRWWRQKQPGATPQMLLLLYNQFQRQSERGFPDDLSETEFESVVSRVAQSLDCCQLKEFVTDFLLLDSHKVSLILDASRNSHHGAMMLVRWWRKKPPGATPEMLNNLLEEFQIQYERPYLRSWY